MGTGKRDEIEAPLRSKNLPTCAPRRFANMLKAETEQILGSIEVVRRPTASLRIGMQRPLLLTKLEFDDGESSLCMHTFLHLRQRQTSFFELK